MLTKPKVSDVDRNKILEMARTKSVGEISKMLGVDGRVVSGIVSVASRLRKATVPAPLMPVPAPPPAPPPARDNFVGGRPAPGSFGGFTDPNRHVRYLVERMMPPDGLLGCHIESFSIEELGQTYGEGTYRISKHEPGRTMPVEYTQKVGPSYGRPRSTQHVDSMLWKVVPTAIVKESIMNRLEEAKKVVASVTMKMKKTNVDLPTVKGEIEFLRSTVNDVDASVEELLRQVRGEKLGRSSW